MKFESSATTGNNYRYKYRKLVCSRRLLNSICVLIRCRYNLGNVCSRRHRGINYNAGCINNHQRRGSDSSCSLGRSGGSVNRTPRSDDSSPSHRIGRLRWNHRHCTSCCRLRDVGKDQVSEELSGEEEVGRSGGCHGIWRYVRTFGTMNLELMMALLFYSGMGERMV